MRKMIHTIRQSDIGHSILDLDTGGKLFLSGVMGYVQPGDVGKRLYSIDGVVQVENDAQRDARLAK